MLCLYFYLAGTQPSIWMMNQPIRLSKACCSRTELLPHTLPGGDTTFLTDVHRIFFVFVLLIFLLYIGKRATAPPHFYNAKKLLPLWTSFSVPKRCCWDVIFSIKGHATMAANESIVDPLVFWNISCFSLCKGGECFDLKI